MPSRVIRIDESAYAILQKVARPLEDNPSDAIRRLASLAGIHQPEPSEPTTPYERQGPVTPHHALREPIIDALRAAGGQLDVPTLKATLRRALADQLTPADRRVLRDGDERWWHAAQTERLRMIQEGLLKKDSRRGVWQLR